MNRVNYFNYCEERLHVLAYRIEGRGKLNFLELNLHSENFYLHLFNAMFGWNLENLNAVKQNSEAIDLIDKIGRIIIQVSATSTKAKVDSALKKDLSSYAGYSFKFILIAKDATQLRDKTYANPHKLIFTPGDDIHDVPSILRVFNTLDIDKQRTVYELIKKELGEEVSPQKVESNLATVIHILSKEDLNRDDTSGFRADPFEIDRKIEENELKRAKAIIEDYKTHHSRVDRIYSEFNLQGVNKSVSVLDSIRRDYLVNQAQCSDDDLFFKIIECVVDRVQKSSNYTPIPIDELELCVNILVVDAFIRCKIFKNPVGPNDAASR